MLIAVRFRIIHKNSRLTDADGLSVISIESIGLAAEELRRADQDDTPAPLRDQLGHRRVRRHVAGLQAVLGAELQLYSFEII